MQCGSYVRNRGPPFPRGVCEDEGFKLPMSCTSLKGRVLADTQAPGCSQDTNPVCG